MRKKRTLVLVGLGLLLTIALVMGLILMAKHEPAFYDRAAVVPGKLRKDMSKTFLGQFVKLAGDWVDGPKGDWDVTFSEEQINSYFEEDFIRLKDAETVRKQGI